MNEVLRTQDALRAAWRQAMEDSLTVGLRARDADGKLVYANRAFCDSSASRPKVLIGRATPMPYWPPDAIADSMSRHLRNLAGNAPPEGYEARWLHSDGRPIDVMIFEAPLVDAGGQQIGWMGSILDITERKRLEERERHQTDAVAHQARLTMLGEVASALAHQLNQPLTSITGYAAGVKRLLERSGQPDARLVDAMGRLGDRAAEAGRIVKRIREIPHAAQPAARGDGSRRSRAPRRGPAGARAAAAAAARRMGDRAGVATGRGRSRADRAGRAELVRNACDEMSAQAPAQRRCASRSSAATRPSRARARAISCGSTSTTAALACAVAASNSS